MENKKKIHIPVVKLRKACYIASGLLILTSLALLIFLGFNLGIDFDSGLSQTVQLAPSGMNVSYTGSDSATLRADASGFTLEIRNSDGVEKLEFPFATYATVGQMGSALSAVDGIDCQVYDPDLMCSGVITGFGFPATLKASGFVVNFEDNGGMIVTIDQVRDALAAFPDAKVQSVGQDVDQVYQIRTKAEDSEGSKNLETGILQALRQDFGSNTVVVLESNFIGAKFSSSLLTNSLLAVLVAVVLILIYVWLRFELGYAICSVIALVHDVVCMLGFILLMRFEVSSTTIAAVLTIIGYSLNNTIVIFDRVRSKVRLQKEEHLTLQQIIDNSVSDSFSRTTISSITTILAIVPLCIFASGEIYYFALSLLFGVVVGTYSSNFIAPALLFSFSRIPALDPTKLKEKKKISDEDSASYLLEEDMVKANAAKMQRRAEAKAERMKKKAMADDDPMSLLADDVAEADRKKAEEKAKKQKRSQLKLENPNGK